MFRKVVATVLFVQDFETCLTFYRDILGLEVAQLKSDFVAFKMDDQDFAIMDLASGAEQIGIEVAAFEKGSGAIDRVMLCVLVENVDATYERLKAQGVAFTKAPVDEPWGLRAAYLRDPDGNILEIGHPLPSR